MSRYKGHIPSLHGLVEVSHAKGIISIVCFGQESSMAATAQLVIDAPSLLAALNAIIDADAAYCDAHGDDAEIAASNKKQNAIDAARKLLNGGAP